MSNKVIASLDIGSNFVRSIVCERGEDGVLNIMGSGIMPCTGLRKGVVVNIEATLRAIAAAIEEAEMMSGLEVTECWTGIGGNHINGFNSRGVVGVSGKKRDAGEREIGEEDIYRVIAAARAVAHPSDRKILEVIPQSYKVDDQKGIKNPLDMIGVRLECDAHIVTCAVTGLQNLAKCVNRAGLKVNEIVLQILAAGGAVLTKDEIELGVVLIDLGGGTTDILVYSEGAPFSTYTIPAGGAQVTSDISIVKNISLENAERIKIDAGCAWEAMLDGDESVLVPGVGGRAPMQIPRTHLLSIIKPRMEELFKMVKQHIDSLNLPRHLGGGVVLIGGGANLCGVVELANHVLRLPARIGTPIPTGKISGLADVYRTPDYAGAVGLVLEGEKRIAQYDNEHGFESAQGDSGKMRFWGKLKRWLKEFG